MEEEVKVISSDADEEVPAEDEGVRPPDGDASDRQEEVEGSDPSPEPEDATAVLQRERDEYLALAQRTQADFENWRKRATRETAAAGQRARSGLMTELLPVVDNLERALASAEAEDGLAGGVKLVHSELVSVLVRNGVEPFDPKGEKFDPGVHEAISTRPDEETGAGVVLDVVEKGYRLGESVLRPARVVVSA
ncbi:MAG: nucleotide exchange factor GrpE [Thermoleophilaceae bacterium]|nr:nucleotide exchange factor GrpE [Thermoleophilaceae bacterium]